MNLYNDSLFGDILIWDAPVCVYIMYILPFCNVHQIFMIDCEESLSVILLHLICDSTEETTHSCSKRTKVASGFIAAEPILFHIKNQTPASLKNTFITG